LSRATEREIKYVEAEEAKWREAMRPHVTPFLLEAFTQLHSVVRNGWAATVAPDLKQLTGRDGVSFEQWAFENADAFKA